MDLNDAIDRFRGPLVGLIASWGVAYVDASELAQESFADAYLNRENCRGDWQQPEVFGRWLRGVARNKFRNWLRSRKRRERRVVPMDLATLEQTVGTPQVAVGQRVVELRNAIDKLPPKQRQAVLMHYLEETSVKDVAALLSVTAKTVEGRLYQARRALRRMMESLRTKTYGYILEEQLAITKLARLIDRPLDIQSQRGFVHETLVSHQCLSGGLGPRLGGFTSSANLDFSNDQATVEAIELMQIYGVPDGVRIDALRSYLRPTCNDQWPRLHSLACVRAASLQRLESLPDIRPIACLDYLRYEQNLMMVILFTLVCIFATLGAAKSSDGLVSYGFL